MIDGIRPPRRPQGGHIRPVDRHLVSKMVIGGKPETHTHLHPAAHPDTEPRADGAAPDTPPAATAEHFEPPEAVQAAEERQPDTNTAAPLYKKHAEKRSSRFKYWLSRRTKWQWALIGTAAVFVLGGGSFGAYRLFHKAAPPPAPVAQKPTPKPTPKPTTVASALTGWQVDPSINDLPVTGIMIENSPDARPQSGLADAGVVFEAVAEGGITRFLTLFQDGQPDYVGPVRSVRPYYVQWAMGFDAPVAHVGGSADGLALVRSGKDLDQFAGGAYFWRISSRAAPHNVYTSIAKLHEYESKKSYGKSNFTSLLRKDAHPSPNVTARSIDFTISGPAYNVHYDYDPATNNYKRSEGGAAHMVVDQSGNQQQLSPRVVVALVMDQGRNDIYTTYQTIGSGHMYVFQDGIVTEGTWHKNSNSEQFSFTDAAGNPLKLNAGQTWITAVGGTDRVSYQP